MAPIEAVTAGPEDATEIFGRKDGRTQMGVRGGTVGSDTALQAGRSRVRFPMVSWEFFIHFASNRN